MSKEFVRFLWVGCVNTVLAYGVYLLLLQIIPYFFAYALAYGTGIIVSYILNTLVVFKSEFSLRKMAAFPLVYAVQYGVNSAALVLFVRLGRIAPVIALALAIALSIPVTFFCMKLIFTGMKR